MKNKQTLQMKIDNRVIESLFIKDINPTASTEITNFLGKITKEEVANKNFERKYFIFLRESSEKLSKDSTCKTKIFDEFKNNYDKYNLFLNVDFCDIEFYSFLNFLRYYNHLIDFFENFKFYTIFSKGEVSVVFSSNQKTSISLQLIFQSDGITRFLSLDEEDDSREKQTYLIEGNFSSSNLVSKSYKIRRLMRILTSESPLKPLVGIYFSHNSIVYSENLNQKAWINS
ncbi:TPA: hypothetical protein ACU8BY_000272 [Neisseria subflava]